MCPLLFVHAMVKPSEQAVRTQHGCIGPMLHVPLIQLLPTELAIIVQERGEPKPCCSAVCGHDSTDEKTLSRVSTSAGTDSPDSRHSEFNKGFKDRSGDWLEMKCKGRW